MDLILDGITKAFWLLVSFDPEVLGITLLSLKISGSATLISLFLGISAGALVAPDSHPPGFTSSCGKKMTRRGMRGRSAGRPCCRPD